MDLQPKLYHELDFDNPDTMKQTIENIKRKKCLYDLYCEQYDDMVSLAKKYLHTSGKKALELGSGGGFMGERYPDIITSDVMETGNVDMQVDAQSLPFEDNSLGVIYASHVIHHIPHITKFLDEANRTLAPDGGMVFVEPYWSPVASFLFTHAHPEPFDKKRKQWDLDEKGPMSGSNQALSYILLKRDKKKFSRLYPNLQLVYDRPFNCLRYICTGGLWLEPKLPQFMFPVLKALEKVFSPLMYLIGIHHIFVIKKIERETS